MEYIYGNGFDMGFRNFRIPRWWTSEAATTASLVVRILILISVATGFAFTQDLL